MFVNILDKFFNRIEIQPNGCHIWTGARAGLYGEFKLNSVDRVLAHIFAFEIFYKVEAKFHIHHKCETKLCVNPEHLEQLTYSAHAREHNKTCHKGHVLLSSTTIKMGNHRRCKVCWNSYQQKYRATVNG